MKGTEQFQQVISAHLELCALRDESFKTKLENPKKNIDDCIKYIISQVHKSGCNGFDDDEIYGMAMHYYDEAELEIKEVSATVVINHKEQKIIEHKTPTLF